MAGVEGSVVAHELGLWEVSSPSTHGFDTGTQEKDWLGFSALNGPVSHRAAFLITFSKQNCYLIEICAFEIEQN